jgi:hypothetical protein
VEPEVLAGGVANAGAVVRIGGEVLRPAPPAAGAIHALLRHVRAAGFDGVPEPLGLEPDGRERLTFVPGDVVAPPYPAWVQEDAALASIASLLRGFHDAQAGFEPPPDPRWSPEFADEEPGEAPVIGHQDVCLENVVFRDGRAVALLDLDFAAPGRRAWDLASLARMCIPVDRAEAAARLGWREQPVAARLRLVADAYGLDAPSRLELLDVLGRQIDRVGGFVAARVAAGEAAFIAMWQATGGQERYDRRRAWYREQRPRFEAAMG